MIRENYPSELLGNAVDAVSSLPGVGSRSALRLSLHLLRQGPDTVHRFTEALNDLVDKAKWCRECMMISDEDVCSICSDPSRNHGCICVVESVRDVMSIESTGQYHGVYHVLGGIISPINGIGPSDIKIRELVSRVQRICDGPDSPEPEVILALSGDVEGETTSFYIYRQFEGLRVRITTLARGLGFGDNLEYADSMTIGRSILNRQPFRPQ